MVDEHKSLPPAEEPIAEAQDTQPSEEFVEEAGGLPPEEDDQSHEPPRRRGGGIWKWLTVLLFLSTLGLGAAGYFIYSTMQAKQSGMQESLSRESQQTGELQRQINSLQSDLSSLNRQLAATQSQIATGGTQVERLLAENSKNYQEKLDQLRQDTERAVAYLQRQLGKTRGDLLVADAEYLLSIALQKLYLVGDVKSVIAALEAADQRLLESGDPAVFKVREELAKEIALLKKLTPPDLIGTSARILALAAKIDELPLFLPHAGKAPQPEAGAEIPETRIKNLEELLGEAWEDFKGLVTIRYSNRPIPAVLQPEEAEAIRQVLYLKLEMARIALLREDEQLYRANLDHALLWIGENFDTTAKDTQAYAEELKALRQAQVKLEAPDVGRSLKLLRDVSRLRLEATPAPARPEGGR